MLDESIRLLSVLAMMRKTSEYVFRFFHFFGAYTHPLEKFFQKLTRKWYAPLRFFLGLIFNQLRIVRLFLGIFSSGKFKEQHLFNRLGHFKTPPSISTYKIKGFCKPCLRFFGGLHKKTFRVCAELLYPSVKFVVKLVCG